MRHDICLSRCFLFVGVKGGESGFLGVVPYVQLKPWLPALVVLRERLVLTPAFQQLPGFSTGRRIAKEVSVPSSIRRFTRPACMRDRRLSEEKSSAASQRDAKML